MILGDLARRVCEGGVYVNIGPEVPLMGVFDELVHCLLRPYLIFEVE